MLASIDFNDDAFRVTGKIGNVPAYAHLATEMRTFNREPVTQVPPKFPLGFGRSGAHRTRELTLRRRLRAILLRPGSWFVRLSHVSAS
jgi:hypothetical protein